MPAHGNKNSIGVALKSDGSEVSLVDWRANRLADALAKEAAGADRIDPNAMQMLADANAAFEYGAALAGVTCKAANCYTERIVMPDGTTTTLTKRDSRPGLSAWEWLCFQRQA